MQRRWSKWRLGLRKEWDDEQRDQLTEKLTSTQSMKLKETVVSADTDPHGQIPFNRQTYRVSEAFARIDNERWDLGCVLQPTSTHTAVTMLPCTMVSLNVSEDAWSPRADSARNSLPSPTATVCSHGKSLTSAISFSTSSADAD